MHVVAGTVAIADGEKAVIDAGADSIKFGNEPGAIRAARIFAGNDVTHRTEISICDRAALKTDSR